LKKGALSPSFSDVMIFWDFNAILQK